MRYRDVKTEIEKTPFVPLRLHVASSKTLDLRLDGHGWMLERSLMMLQDSRDRKRAGLYDVIAVELIERIEQLPF